jgi:hypothetical protein
LELGIDQSTVELPDAERVNTDVLWGAKRIAAEIGVTVAKALFLLEHGLIPGRKIGRMWCSSRSALRARTFQIEEPTDAR